MRFLCYSPGSELITRLLADNKLEYRDGFGILDELGATSVAGGLYLAVMRYYGRELILANLLLDYGEFWKLI